MIITSDHILLFRSLFRGRENVYARFWNNAATQKSSFAPVYRLNKQSEPLNDNIIRKHLLGVEIIGVYPLLSDNKTYFLAIDFDERNWLSESVKVCKISSELDLPCYLECSKSGNGSHIWFFFQDKVPAWKVRKVGKYLLRLVGVTNRGSFDRMFPSQDEHTGKGLGNLIALPLQGKSLTHGNSSFIDEAGDPCPNQWEFLKSIQKISEVEINTVLRNSNTEKGNTSESSKFTKEDEDLDLVKTTDSPVVKLTLSNQISIPSAFLPDKLYKFLKGKLNFPNPLFYELERKGYSTWNTPRFIKTIEPGEEGICIPSGFLNQTQEFADKNDLVLEIEDKQIKTKSVAFNSNIVLRPEQKKISKELFKYERVILEAKPGFGKTVVALDYIKRRKQKTLIIVHAKQLMDQWKKQIQERFSLSKKEIGIIRENKWNIGDKITIASYLTLARRDLTEIKEQFGLIVVDECHHIPANTFTKVLKTFPAKYILGLTATAIRRDKLERLMNFYIGPIVTAKSETKVSTDKKSCEDTLQIKLFTRQTQFTTKSKDFYEIGNELIGDIDRNVQIVGDLTEVLQSRAKCLILTERIEHCETLYALIRKNIKGVEGTIAIGRMTKTNREKLLTKVRKKRFHFLVATGKLIGEGFDWPELTHLFLAFPSSWKGKLIQYIGRLERQSGGKDKAFVYDYVDYAIPMLRIMYFKRLRIYRSLGIVKEKSKSRLSKMQISENQLQLF